MSEKVYDEQISPLVGQIIEICKANDIGYTALFEYVPYDYDPEEDNIGLCKTNIPSSRNRPQQLLAEKAIAAEGKGMLLSNWIANNMDKLAPEVFGFTVTTSKD